MKTGLRCIPILIGFCWFLPNPIHAQWTTQTIQLQPGWNAIHLELQPDPRDCDTLFSGLQIESVWCWNRRYNAVQFIQDPETLVPEDPNWLYWVPPGGAGRESINLHVLLAGRSYLIKTADASEPANWQIMGRPVLRNIEWLSDSWNLSGFAVDSANPPTFQDFFAGSPEHTGQPIYRLNPSGHWEPVSAPGSAQMKNAEAFWIRVNGTTGFPGPLEVKTDQRSGLEFGRSLSEAKLTIKNNSPASKAVTIRSLASAAPPNEDFPAYAGSVPLSYFEMDLANELYQWVPLPAELMFLDLAPGEEWNLRLEVLRHQMADYTPPPGITDVLYQGLLEVIADSGERCLVGVTAQGLQTFESATITAHSNGTGGTHPRAGLWVGVASIDKVNQPANVNQPNTPVATPTEFQFRLIVHVDAGGQPRLCQKVLQMWKEGTTKPHPDNPDLQVIDQPGRFVLVTDESLIPSFSGALVRDGDPVARRVSSAAFSFDAPIPMTGSGEFGANTVGCEVVLDYDDPVNPFKHRYHPDHNNLNESFQGPLSEGVESFTIVRNIELEFQPADPDGFSLPGWGGSQLGGIYRETMTGLHRHPIRLLGTFRLHQASTVPVLNDGL